MSIRSPSSGVGFFSRARNFLSTIFSTKESARDLQECADLYQTLLLTTFRDLRVQHGLNGPCSSISKESSQKLEEIYEQASSSLENDIFQYRNRGLRLKVQTSIHPQVVSILQSCKKIDSQFPTDIDAAVDSDEEEESDIKEFCKGILLNEWQKMVKSRDDTNRHSRQSQLDFLHRKQSALEILLYHYGWQSDLRNTGDLQCLQSIAPSTIDDFGYSISADEEMNDAIRYQQMLNLTKSTMLRDFMGYSVSSLKSSISHPLAGRGIYIDGFAPAGSILAFFPGAVWPKEHLLGGLQQTKHFATNPNYHLSMRYDDVMIDSRKSPYTVLNGKNSNMFAVAHIVNHPPKPSSSTDSYIPTQNCSTLSIDFTQSMNLDSLQLNNYIPNTFARPPMPLGPKALDDPENVALMYGYGLIASRDLCNEEIFYDYRLLSSDSNAESFPEWYHVCKQEEHEESS